MKILILFLLVGISSPVIGQNWWTADDSLDINSRILKMDLPQQEIDLRVKKFHKQRSDGTLIMLGGTAISAASMYIFYKHDNDGTKDGDGNKTNYSAVVIGGTMMVLGGVIRMDAYKHLRVKRKK